MFAFLIMNVVLILSVNIHVCWPLQLQE